jgi:DNA-binding XRE family transcriptional regulator
MVPSKVIEEYVERLRMLREMVSGESQSDFAERIGIDLKRWNNFERGYPLPRDVAFTICETFKGLTPDWIWFGYPNNLSNEWRRKIEQHRPRRSCAFHQVPWKN